MAPRKFGKKAQVFEYQGYNKKNDRVSGEIEAASLPVARAALLSQGISILKIQKKTSRLFTWGGAKKVKSEDIAIFTRQLATLIAAGIPLVQSLSVIVEGMPNTGIGNLIQKIKLDVESGTSFSASLKKHPQYFDELYCGLVETGEHSGTLENMLNRIAVYQEKIESLKRKVKKAMYYPIAVLIIAAIVTSILLVKVVPTFKEMFASFGASLPAFTVFVLNISDLLQTYGLYILGGLIVVVYLFIYFYRTRSSFRQGIERTSLRVPIIGKILQKTAIARFTRTLATTTAAGVPLTEALSAVANASGNIVYSQAILKIKDIIATGSQMRTAMKKTGIFPPMVVQMVGIGEESGSLEQMLSKIATIYEEEVDTSVDGLTTLLEPLIMVILGIIVGGLVVAMYMPIFQMGAIF